jgi:hypothetical protein
VSDEPGMGVAWYTPSAWAQLAALPEAKIEKTYQDFVRDFWRTVREFEARGVRVERVTVDVAAMTEWCRRHGYEIDSKGRTVYVAMLMAAGSDPNVLATMPIVDNTRSVQ